MVYLSVTISYPLTQFEELYRPFINLGGHLPPEDNSPLSKYPFIGTLIIGKLKGIRKYCYEIICLNYFLI